MDMDNKLICRLCLRKEHPRYCKTVSPLEENEESCNILEMLSYCIPEIDIFLVVDPVICLRCINLLEAAFNFKTECLKIEEKLLTLSQTIDSKIDLNCFYKNLKTVNNNDHTLINMSETEGIEVIKIERALEQKSESGKKGTNFNCDKCYGCKNKFKDPSYHNKVYVSPFICYNCGKQANTIEQFRKHITKHRRQRKCKVCQKNFRDLTQLTVHLRTHTGSKPFSCKLCGKSFRQKHNRDQHLRAHRGDSTVKCNVCDKVFSTKYNLKVHVQNTHVKKPRCELCGAGFYTKSALIKHLETDLETCGKTIKTEILAGPPAEDFIKTEPEYVFATESIQKILKEENLDEEEYKPVFTEEVDIVN
ncbi:zinc finger protein 37 homolog isoform X2 [Anoplophora glabripennis]|uniref:zinc finger protein 37 homolog isoform X2 n=1 Tax=Anoplophora glabripennis TaxID=217634 RepID=UPI00087350A2|nr:zinc finger protein 37 homolog isoform X2 [Anoplophora glabripennis]